MQITKSSFFEAQYLIRRGGGAGKSQVQILLQPKSAFTWNFSLSNALHAYQQKRLRFKTYNALSQLVQIEYFPGTIFGNFFPLSSSLLVQIASSGFSCFPNMALGRLNADKLWLTTFRGSYTVQVFWVSDISHHNCCPNTSLGIIFPTYFLVSGLQWNNASQIRCTVLGEILAVSNSNDVKQVDYKP